MDDQRRATRFAVSWPLRIGNRTSGRTFNISSSGILFLSQSRLELESVTDLEIALAPGRRIGCTVRIIREAPTSTNYYAYGAEFLGFKGTDRGVLANILQRMRIQQGEESGASTPDPAPPDAPPGTPEPGEKVEPDNDSPVEPAPIAGAHTE